MLGVPRLLGFCSQREGSQQLIPKKDDDSIPDALIALSGTLFMEVNPSKQCPGASFRISYDVRHLVTALTRKSASLVLTVNSTSLTRDPACPPLTEAERGQMGAPQSYWVIILRQSLMETRKLAIDAVVLFT